MEWQGGEQMEDEEIVRLYFRRDEEAIRETDQSYGVKLNRLALRILNNREDAEECVNDTYLKAWDTIPPQRPRFLYAYLAKICRFFSFGKLDWKNAAKRKAEVVELTAEMESCIPDGRVERQLEGEEIGRLVSRFLYSIPQENRLLFMRRYWYMESIQEIALRFGISESNAKIKLFRIRNQLKEFLEREGIHL